MDVHHDKDTNTIGLSQPAGLAERGHEDRYARDVLAVSGETQSASGRSEGYAIHEQRYGKGDHLSLPHGVKVGSDFAFLRQKQEVLGTVSLLQSEDIKASMKDGVLNITFQKSVPETGPVRITLPEGGDINDSDSLVFGSGVRHWLCG